MEFISKEQLLNFIITHLEIKYCHVILAMDTRWAQIQNCILFKGTCCLSSQPLVFPPVYGMLEKKLAKSVSSKSQRQHMKEVSPQDFCGSQLLLNGSHSWQTTNPDQIHKTTPPRKQRRESMHSLFRVSWGYMIQWWSKLDWHPAGRAPRDTQLTEDQRAPYS